MPLINKTILLTLGFLGVLSLIAVQSSRAQAPERYHLDLEWRSIETEHFLCIFMKALNAQQK